MHRPCRPVVEMPSYTGDHLAEGSYLDGRHQVEEHMCKMEADMPQAVGKPH